MTRKITTSQKLDRVSKLWVCAACGEKIESRERPTISNCGVQDAFFATGSNGQYHPSSGSDSTESENVGSVPLTEDAELPRGHRTGILALDRALSGGIPSGVGVLLFGPSYSGKSTLAIQIAAGLPPPLLLVCPEMSAPVLKTIAVRSGADLSRAHRYDGDLYDWPQEAVSLGARVAVIDSVQKFGDATRAADTAISWAQSNDGIALMIAHESRRGKPLARGEYFPDAVFRLTRTGTERTLFVQKARWNGYSGRVRL